MQIKYCYICGAATCLSVPKDDAHQRIVCPSCGNVHYENPKVVVGTIPVLGDKILMCRRDIEPRKGKWTLPAGYLENNETVQEGAMRETLEETKANVRVINPYRMFNIVFVKQIYLMFRAELRNTHFGKTSESSEVRLFWEEEIPWPEIAFEVIRQTLEDFCKDRQSETYEFMIKDLEFPTETFKMSHC